MPETSLSVNSLTVRRGDFELTTSRWEAVRGEIVGLVGANGAGKTTFLNALAGKLRPQSGEIEILRVPIVEYGWRLPQVLGFVPDTLAALEDLSMEAHFDLLRAVYERWDPAYAESLAMRLNVPLNKRAARLSRGTRAKAAFILAEAARPPILILDEPTSGLDPVVRQELLTVLREVRADSSARSIIFSTHTLEDLIQAADSISLVRRGMVYPRISREAANDWQSPRGAWQSEAIASVFGVESFA